MDLSAVYFPSAVALGALHALEPGHAKTLTAAYLIGTKGTKRDALLLGLSVAVTHSIVVVALCVGAVWIGREAFTQDAAHWLAVGSGAVVILLGVWLLAKRLRVQRRPSQIHTHAHESPGSARVPTAWGEVLIEIIGTPEGERVRVTMPKGAPAVTATVSIDRGADGIEGLPLQPDLVRWGVYLSTVAPAEPHEFDATLSVNAPGRREEATFHIHEAHDHAHGHDHAHQHDHPDDHGHGQSGDHANMSDDEHARAHAATLPKYVGTGERPTPWQVMAFGAAGGMIPCPAAVTVMLLSLSVAKTGNGLFLVAGFSLGLAITLVGLGLLVVMGISKLSGTDRFSWLSRSAPVISASLVIVSGAAGLIVALAKGH